MLREGGDDSDILEITQKRHQQSLKNDLIKPEKGHRNGAKPARNLIAQTYAVYQRMLKAYNAVDFDDLIMVPTLLFPRRPRSADALKKNPLSAGGRIPRHQHQPVQVVKLLVGQRNGLTVVGDDDQSIYAWRARALKTCPLLKGLPTLKIIKLGRTIVRQG